jgi:hypothetical protein
MREPLYVEASPLLARNLTGIGRFTARLVEGLAQRASLRLITTRRRHELRRDGLRTDLAFGEEIHVASGSLPPADGDLERWVRDLLRRPKLAHEPDASRRSPCLFPLFRPEVRHFSREVSVLYDLTPLLLPHLHEPWVCREFGRFFAHGLPLSDGAIAVSHSTKADASWLCPLPAERIRVAHPGPSLCVGRHASARGVERRSDLILIVSTREPRKNARFVLDWFLDSPSLPPGAEIRWVGPRGWLWESSMRTRRRGRAARRFRFAGAVSDAALCELYRSAAFTIYASLYEGFGFPVLDSLLHGTPVACSYNSSLKEFEGPGVYPFDPCDTASLDGAVRDLLAGPSSFDRADLGANCSWKGAAEAVIELCGSTG